MTDWGNIAIGLRIGHAPDPAFFISWTRLISTGLRPADMVLHPAVNLPHSIAANYIVREFLQSSCDSLLMMDDDHVFEPDAAERIRASAHEFDAVGALIMTRRWPMNPLALRFIEGGVARIEGDLVGVREVDMCGLGFTLIRRRLLALDCFDWDNRLGEDGLFFQRARQTHAGRFAVNCDLRIGHRVTGTAFYGQDGNTRFDFHTFGIGQKTK